MTTTRILTGLTIATALSCSIVFAKDDRHVGDGTGPQRVEFAQHGDTTCVLVDRKVFCAPAATQAPIKMASIISR